MKTRRPSCGGKKKLKSKNSEENQNPKKSKKYKIQKKRERKIQKNRKKKIQKKWKSLSSVVLDKMCVFCLYPIPDSQQYVKRGSCRRLILSGLLCLFSFLGLGPICDGFWVWVSNLVIFFSFVHFIESLSRFCISYLFCVYFISNCYLSLNVMLCLFRIVSCHVFVLIHVQYVS